MKAFAHITGGGLTGNVPRVLPASMGVAIDLGAIRMQPVFHWLAEAGKVDEAEMLRTFNCGIGFTAVVAPHDADAVAACFLAQGDRAFPIGIVERREDDKPDVLYSGKLGAAA
jgi:phosphoribosylformylglycinamidine cyclo-ligase